MKQRSPSRGVVRGSKSLREVIVPLSEWSLVVWNSLIGGLMVPSGLCGTHVLRGTDSSEALVVVGGVLLLLGVKQIASKG